MERNEILKLFDNINVWSRGDERAPHKPLLLLYALGKCLRGENRFLSFKDSNEDIRNLLIEFGPSRKSYHAEYPFWRLKNDKLWELSSEDLIKRLGNTDPKKSELIDKDICGGFTNEIFEAIKKDRSLAIAIIETLLSKNFPDSLHEDLLTAVGIDINELIKSGITKRDPGFRQRILQIYEYKCVVCGSDLRLGAVNIGLEAAHIKWHQAGGPDTENNGLSLCILHHKLFDRGAFSISDNYKILVSQQANGSGIIADILINFHEMNIKMPIKDFYNPKIDFLRWHQKEVFRSPSR
jgi:putative restriction endonuclease